jgi:hypothetical protein
MDKPSKVKIGWQIYTITWLDEVKDDKGKRLYGQIIDDECTIQMEDKESSLERKKETLLHEIIHGIDNFANLSLTERQVTVLANMLFEIDKDNKDVTDWIFD